MSETSADGVRLVRPYTVTGGRTRSSRGEDLPMETLVSVTEAGRAGADALQFERAQVVRLCTDMQSVAEVSAHLRLPLGVARVLVGDLHAEGMLDAHMPVPASSGPDVDLLGKVLDGLQAL